MEARAATGQDNPTFPEIAPVLAYGDKALGYDKICPRDGKVGCSIVDAVTFEHHGRANQFLSWSWGYKMTAVIGALAEWMKKVHADPKKTFIWMCFACLNQFRMIEDQKSGGGADNLDCIFRQR